MLQFLAFESSCDDTSVALLRASSGDILPKLVSMSVQSQWEVHEKYGGVVPEMASRAHLQNLVPCIEKVLLESKISLREIDVFVATDSPGLVGCLLIGHTAAKTLSMLYEKPFVSCHHIESHLMSVFLDRNVSFPFLGMVVSGGHTSLYLVKSYDDFELVGWAIDDAIGEAFDKGAKLLGCPLPGGPHIDRLAQSGNPERYRFGKVRTPELRFSFSGIKSELVRLRDREGTNWKIEDVAASYQRALLDHLFEKIEWARSTYNVDRVAFVGGVACNSELRRRASSGSLFPPMALCTDNAAMVGIRGYRKFLRGEISDLSADVKSTSRPKLKRTA